QATGWNREDLDVELEQHVIWLESRGESGTRADFTGANLRGMDLTGVNLRRAILNKTDLKGTDLSLADLQGASLIQADLTDASLLGAQFQEADLQGAILAGAQGLWAGGFGGANLFGAVLPVSLSLRNGAVAKATVTAYRFLCALLLAN